MVGYLSLCRDHHSKDLVSAVHGLLETNNLVDCILSADGQFLRAHKIILSACSPYFQLLFKEEIDKNPIVVFKDIEFEYLKLIINFVYSGEVQVFETQLDTFLEVAKFLQIKGLNANSRECTPERANITGNEVNVTDTANEVIIDDDDCQVISDNVTSEVQEQPSADSVDGPLMITDEVTYSLVPRANSESGNLINTIERDWHSRPTSPVSVASITSVKTEQLIDCEETHVQNEVSESEKDSPESEQALQTKDVGKPRDNSSSVIAERMDETDNTATVVKQNNSPGKKPCPSPVRLPRKVKKTQRPAERETRGEEEGEDGEASGSGRASGRRSNTCPECKKSFKFRTWLNLHVRQHTGERPYKCPECPKSFGFMHNLNSHVATHARRRPHRCELCGMRFAAPMGLQNHLKVHAGEKPFSCEECGYATAYRADLVRHQRRHTGERPYKCAECDYTASCSSHLASHRRMHERTRRLISATGQPPPGAKA